MNPPEPHIVLRREALGHALHHLPALHFTVLGRLLMRACPRTGRVWTTPDRLAVDAGLSIDLAEHALRGMESVGLLSVYSERARVLCIELGALFVRPASPPDNLPVEPV